MTQRAAVPITLRRRAIDGHAPVRMLLLHGMGGGTNNWNALAPHLDPAVEVWEAALPWAATADPAWAIDRDAAIWIQRALSQCPGGAPDVIVAHSFAANAVLELMDRHGSGWEPATVLLAPFYRADVSEFEWDSVRYYFDGFRAMLDQGVALTLGDRVDAGLRADMVERMCTWMGPYTWLRFFDSYLRTPTLRLAEITSPTLLIGGAHDPGALPAGVRALGTALPRSETVILDDTGHFAMAERPAEVAATVNDFVYRTASRARPRVRHPRPHPADPPGVAS
ncbi:alpha/beta fold hydrolase [Nocardia sp. N2S4-5]|uniref:alpha/beta fold hydrolase n=1 Tax=Nocardia sp. N2S4-5 TaxID=3351565 RepID=UPI0037CD17A8